MKKNDLKSTRFSNGSSNAEQQPSAEIRLPSSRKVYFDRNPAAADHPKRRIRVPFREIALTPSKDSHGVIEENPPVLVYDTSGPWTDPDRIHNVRDGLSALRRDWIVGRGDVEEYDGREVLPQDNGY
jgi:phosphomethylpyrimidine synthase